MSHQTLDMCGYNCPMPILKTKQALAKMDTKAVSYTHLRAHET